MDDLEQSPSDIVLNFSAVGFINSTNISQLLRLRKTVSSAKRRMILCDVNSQVWGILLVTGLEKIFEFTSDVTTALATLQLAEAQDQETQRVTDRQ
ncbi:unnamed protein product [marine sediment metagenome]|uniref:STAS domain-containing protein n=1 Tax=marine sediment metagenome TaxID=412755 RepID=X1BC86_9ZZZZ